MLDFTYVERLIKFNEHFRFYNTLIISSVIKYFTPNQFWGKLGFKYREYEMISSRICSSKRHFQFIEMPISIMPQAQNKSTQEKGKYPASYSKFNISCSPVLTIQFAQWKCMNRLYFSNNLVRRLYKTLTIVSRKDMLFLYP